MSETDETTGTVATEASTTPRKRSAAQLVLDRATEDCAAFAKLSGRLERVRVAFEGQGAQQPDTAAAQAAPAEPRPTSHLEGLAFIHACNVEVLRRMEFVIGRFEDILDCGPAS